MTSELAPVRPPAPAIPSRPAGTAATDVVSPDDARLETWRSFLHAHAVLVRRLDEELQAAHHLSLAEYDALLQLVNAPNRRLRMSVLADRVLLSRSGITRLVDRLVGAGMVERSACTTDARGAEASITPAGLERLRAASGTHLAGVGRLFLDVVEPGDRAVIQRALGRVLANLGHGPAVDAGCTPGTGEA